MASLRNKPIVRRVTLGGWDVACWAGAALFVLAARYDFDISTQQQQFTLFYVVCAAVLVVVAGYVSKLYRGRFKIASFDEAIGIFALASIVGTISFVAFGVVSNDLPRGIAVLSPPVALVAMLGGRWLYRMSQTRGSVEELGTKTVLIYGAGDAGHQLLRVIRTDRSSPYRVIGLIDDNPAKRNLRLMGVPMVGNRRDMIERAVELGAEGVIMAISSASGRFVGDVQDEVEAAGLEFLAVPQLSKLIGGRVQIGDVQRVDIADVLGRRQVETDVSTIADYLTGKCVLITGAGGSIGSELARQVNRFGPSELVLLDRDESALHAVQLSIYGRGLLDTRDMVLADIRDVEALRPIFAQHRPEIVFHAAALKHLPMLEMYPEEGWKTNVIGTQNMLDLSEEFGVSHFVNISTDKAADPTSVLGHTKRIAERLTATKAVAASGAYISVRFGNVLGSRGSMLHTFNSQIETGGPLTVTHPEITRYFMTIPEACELVIQAGATGESGQVHVLDMGTPVKILDVAKRMIAKSGKAVDIVFTGLRPGEKMHEELFGEDEVGTRSVHPLISHVAVPPIGSDELDRSCAEMRERSA